MTIVASDVDNNSWSGSFPSMYDIVANNQTSSDSGVQSATLTYFFRLVKFVIAMQQLHLRKAFRFVEVDYSRPSTR